MATLVTQIPTLTFPEELDSLEFSGTPSKTFLLDIIVNDYTIMSEIFSFVSSRVVLYDLASLLRDFAKLPVNTVQIAIDGSVVATTSLLQCRLAIGAKAEDFVQKRFLTQCDLHKDVIEYGIEYVSFYSETGTDTVKITLQEITAANVITNHTVEKQLSQAPGIITLELNLAELVRKSRVTDIFSVIVEVGKRRIIYLWLVGPTPEYRQMTFVNSFGVKETVLFNEVSKNLKTNYSLAKIHGKLRNYNTTSTMEYTGYADAIEDSEAEVYQDFCRASEIWRTEDNAPMALTNSKFEDPGTSEAVGNLKATWSESGEVPYYNPQLVPVKLFDETFDFTFN